MLAVTSRCRYSAADGSSVVASYVPAAAAPDACGLSPSAPCLLNNGGASIRALAGVPLQGSTALTAWYSPVFPTLSLLLLPLQATLAPLPFRMLAPSSDWSDAALRAATSSEQASFIASPVGMTIAADGTVHLPQTVSSVAGGFGMYHTPTPNLSTAFLFQFDTHVRYQLSLAATHPSGLFTILQHVLVRVCAPTSEPLPVISFANASSDYDSATSRFTCYPRQPCVLRLLAAHFTTLNNQSLLKNTSVVTISNASTAASSHQLLLVQAGNPAVYDLVWLGLAPAQQPVDADTGTEAAVCLQAFLPSGCPSPPTCLSVRIASRPPLILQPTAPSITSCENTTVSLLFNISNTDPLETISFKFDDLPLPLPSYGIAVGSSSFSSNVAGVQHLTFRVKLTSFSCAVQRKRPATASLCSYYRYTCE